MTKIRDGAGTGSLARVTSTNRLAVQAQSSSAFAVLSAESASAFVVTTGASIAVPTAVERAVLFVQNTTAAPLTIGAFAVGSAGAGVWRAYLNPTNITGGTIATLSPSNLNLASGRTFGGTARRGDVAGASTVTGGTVGLLGATVAGFTTYGVEGALILGLNNSVALTFSNTTAGTLNVEANIFCAFAS